MYRFLFHIRLSLHNFVLHHLRMPLFHWQMQKYHILDADETIRMIREQHLSVSRFGDGEFSVICSQDHDYRSENQRLRSSLRSLLSCNEKGILVCIPFFLHSLDGTTDSAYNFWANYLLRHCSFFHAVLDEHLVYGNSLFTRFYIDYTDKSQAATRINSIRGIWEGQHILVVEGRFTRSGVGNDLYDNCAGVQRILCPEVDAFYHYEDILSFIRSNVSKERLIILLLGVTATAMAYDLHRLGYWAIDLGHADVEYDWMRMGVTFKSSVPGKYVLEATDGTVVSNCDDPQYKAQIIAQIL